MEGVPQTAGGRHKRGEIGKSASMRNRKITRVKRASGPGITMKGLEGVRWEEHVAVKDFEKRNKFRVCAARRTLHRCGNREKIARNE